MRFNTEREQRLCQAGFKHTHEALEAACHGRKRKNKIDHKLAGIMQGHRAPAPRSLNFEIGSQNMRFFGFES